MFLNSIQEKKQKKHGKGMVFITCTLYIIQGCSKSCMIGGCKVKKIPTDSHNKDARGMSCEAADWGGTAADAHSSATGLWPVLCWAWGGCGRGYPTPASGGLGGLSQENFEKWTYLNAI
jgi:hypothetical protein